MFAKFKPLKANFVDVLKIGVVLCVGSLPLHQAIAQTDTPVQTEVQVSNAPEVSVEDANTQAPETQSLDLPQQGPILSDLIRAEISGLGSKKSNSKKDLEKIYGNRAFLPIWRDGSQWLPRARQAFTILSSSERQGLRSKEYIDPIFLGQQPTSPIELAKADIALTRGVVAYIRDLRFGRYNPKNDYGPKRKERVDDSVEVFEASLTLENYDLWLNRMGPATIQYQTLLSALFKYEEIVENGGWPIIRSGGVLKLGVVDKRVPLLRKTLAIMGDFELDEAGKQSLALMASVDMSDLDEEIGLGGNKFDSQLDTAVKKFQERHGLLVDGILGGRSQDILRISAAERLDQIKINLERLRWDRSHENRRYVRVNIPEYRLRAYVDNEQVLEMPVVVGKSARPTPELNDYIVNVKFNPDWTVPRSIVLKDIFPALVKNPAYPNQNNMEATYKGKVIDTSSFDMSFADPSAMGFRQLPGPKNPLGSFRFSMTNNQSIFLHDTPKKFLFGNTSRANSSGCVRVGDAKSFAKFLIDDPAYSSGRISRIVDNIEIEFRRLEEPVAVALSY
ncbi:MAG: L,D-transpeptidase family protein, partial [Alphaproteobacteria bacterium]